MFINNLKCNRIKNPLGFELEKPRLSWTVKSTGKEDDVLTRILVCESEDFNDLFFDSGFIEDYDDLYYAVDKKLSPNTRYYWKVVVQTGNDEFQSDTAWFETAKTDRKWKAEWIKPDFDDSSIHPLLRKEINVREDIESARAYVCGLGIYEMEINGERVGDEYLTPYCNAYDKWIQYQTYDITDLLRKGKNCFGALLGNGWYKGRFAFGHIKDNIYGNEFAFLCETVVKYTDGTTETFSSSNDWKCFPGFVTESGIYDGEVQNEKKYPQKWSEPGYDDSSWSAVTDANIGYNLLQARKSLPVRVTETIIPCIIKTPKDETVLDFGQNMVGWVEFRTKNPVKGEITLHYGEELQDGCFYRDNLRSAKAVFKYISDGKSSYVRPRFTFFGFRYVKLEGWTGQANPEDFIGCVVHSDLEITGKIETSNPKVNKLFNNAMWSQRGNFLDVPTDCPQRDERLGWTGDAQAFCDTACFNMDSYAFFSKYMYDLKCEQADYDGGVPPYVPVFKSDISEGKRIKEGPFTPPGSCGWGDVATILPWTVYLHSGDKSILSEQFDSMKAWVDAIGKYGAENFLWSKGFHFGDWLAPDSNDPDNISGATSHILLASCFYSYSARLVSKSAKALSRKEEEIEYAGLSDRINKAVLKEFLTSSGKLSSDTQTAYAVMLFMNIVPEKNRQGFADRLAQKVMEKNYKIQTGFLGTPYLCRVLSENGYNEISYKLLLNEECPGWLYTVKMGATTIWERWNSLLPDGSFSDTGMNSLNHYAYGSIASWMYRYMCGINPSQDKPGFKEVFLSPMPDPSLEWAKATLNTPCGKLESSWKYSKGGLEYNFLIPFASKAKVSLPYIDGKTMIINGEPLPAPEKSSEKISFTLEPGKYCISSN